MRFLITDLESKWKMYYGLKTERRYPDEDMHWKEGHIADHTLPSHTSGSGNEKHYYDYILLYAR